MLVTRRRFKSYNEQGVPNVSIPKKWLAGLSLPYSRPRARASQLLQLRRFTDSVHQLSGLDTMLIILSSYW